MLMDLIPAVLFPIKGMRYHTFRDTKNSFPTPS